MANSPNELDGLIAALQDDLPNESDERRARARLAAAGVVVGGGVTTLQASSAAAAAGTNVTANVTASVSAGGGMQGAGLGAVLSKAAVFSKAAGASIGAKSLVVATTLAVGASYPVVSSWVGDAPAVVPPVPVAASSHAEQRVRVAPYVTASKPKASAPATPERERAPRLVHTPAPSAGSIEAHDAAPVGQSASAAARAANPEQLPPAQLPRVIDAQPTLNPSASSSLEEETQLIEWALRARRGGDTASAEHWLSEHRRRFPRGALAPERERALDQLHQR